MPAPPIVTVRLANRLLRSGSSRAVYGLTAGAFVLSVGDVVLRKNHALLVRVWRLLDRRGVQLPKLVIAGRNDPEGADLVGSVRADPDWRDRILFLANVDDEALGWLYARARFTVFPSFLEGFGLPVAESSGER